MSCLLLGGLAHNSGMSPDWGSNLGPFGLQWETSMPLSHTSHGPFSIFYLQVKLLEVPGVGQGSAPSV